MNNYSSHILPRNSYTILNINLTAEDSISILPSKNPNSQTESPIRSVVARWHWHIAIALHFHTEKEEYDPKKNPIFQFRLQISSSFS